MLDGQGADEILGGYIPLTKYFFRELYAQKQYWPLLREMWLHRQRYGGAWTDLLPRRLLHLTKSWLNNSSGRLSAPPLNWIRPQLAQSYAGQSYYLANAQQNPFGSDAHFSNVLYQLTFFNNLQSLLKYEDRNSMAFSVEARVPFLDSRLVEFIFQLPSTVKVQGGFTKRVMRDAMAGILPEKIRWRVSKLGFATPEQTWEQHVLQPLIEQAVRDEKLQPYLHPEQALAYWKAIRRTTRQDSAPWRWVNLSLWMKVYNL
jgi:asparagine synthase (glutamine-hydrolysing)